MPYVKSGPGLLGRYSDLLRAGRSGDRIPVGGEICRARPDRLWGPSSLLYNGYRVFPGGKAAGACCWSLIPIEVPRSWKGRAIPLLTLCAFIACYTLAYLTSRRKWRVYYCRISIIAGKKVDMAWMKSHIRQSQSQSRYWCKIFFFWRATDQIGPRPPGVWGL